MGEPRVSGFVLTNAELNNVSGLVLANPELNNVSGFALANPEAQVSPISRKVESA
jgi:hypothetical protein